MHVHTLENWRHSHDFSVNNAHGERRTRYVLADALTSLLAIVALLAGKYFGWNWMDPVMGIVGAMIITRWSYGLLRQASPILLDGSIGADYQAAIQEAIERDADNRASDIHIWKVGANHNAAIISLVTHFPRAAAHYKALLGDFHMLSHVTIEVNACDGDVCMAPVAGNSGQGS